MPFDFIKTVIKQHKRQEYKIKLRKLGLLSAFKKIFHSKSHKLPSSFHKYFFLEQILVLRNSLKRATRGATLKLNIQDQLRPNKQDKTAYSTFTLLELIT